jgi:hypothetical protein
MYFPLLRGKQFELIALREICDILSKKKDKVSPILEPVKDSSTLNSLLQEFKKSDINFSVIINPEVGDLQNKFPKISEIILKELDGYSNFQIGINVSAKTKHDLIQRELLKFDRRDFGLTLIHNIEVPNPTQLLKDYSKICTLENNVINIKGTGSRYHRQFDRKTTVRLEDFFPIQDKNADYLPILDSKFSEEHLYYKEDGYKGFSDYLIVGDNYMESGFLPYAIAIHLTYIYDNSKIRIKHFVSDSNEDTSDIAGKFLEALEKLVAWSKTLATKTRAITIFEELYSTQHFPGLGTLKKLSIMHHIELVLSVI